MATLFCERFKPSPGVKISEEALDIHHISERDLENEHEFEYYAATVHEILTNATAVYFHQAEWDSKIINHQLSTCNLSPIDPRKVRCTVKIAEELDYKKGETSLS